MGSLDGNRMRFNFGKGVVNDDSDDEIRRQQFFRSALTLV